MSALDREIRQSIEEFIDNVLKDPAEIYDIISSQLMAQGIQPDTERVLCAVSGYLYGRVRANYLRFHKKRKLSSEELDSFHELMRRRTIELREALTLDHLK